MKYYMHENKYKGSAKEERAYTLVKWIYSIVYYFISSVAGYILIKDTSFFPTWLGGHGACLNIINGVPAIPEATLGMKIFYLIQFGKHFARFIIHMFIHQEGNYYEYILHHSLSTFLILFSYLTNQWLIGIMVLLCHDISDLFLIFCRGYKVSFSLCRTTRTTHQSSSMPFIWFHLFLGLEEGFLCSPPAVCTPVWWAQDWFSPHFLKLSKVFSCSPIAGWDSCSSAFRCSKSSGPTISERLSLVSVSQKSLEPIHTKKDESFD